ncbi:MAG: hypothetical protein V4726_04820 [Verrucomicrobiota bacterium]
MNRLRRFFRVHPMSWTPRETLVMRLLFALVILFSGILWEAAKLPPAGEPLKAANGLAKLLPLGWMANPQVLTAGKLLTAAGLGFYVAGLAPVLSLLPALVFMLGTGSLRNSMGDISHHTQLVALVLLGQWIVCLVGAIREKSWLRSSPELRQRLVFWSILIISSTYLASGITKLRASDYEWIQRTPRLSVQIIKSVSSATYSSGQPVSGFKAETAPMLIARHPHLAQLFFAPGLLLELGAALMVLSLRHARWIALTLIAMHFSISVIMEIDFLNHVLLLLIFAVNVPGWFIRKPKPAAESALPVDAAAV